MLIGFQQCHTFTLVRRPVHIGHRRQTLYANEAGDLKVPTVDSVLLVTYDLVNTQIYPHNNMPSFHDITVDTRYLRSHTG